jgi:hypothetical protein
MCENSFLFCHAYHRLGFVPANTPTLLFSPCYGSREELKSLRENSILEGHGLSRAVKVTVVAGFSR